MHFNNPYSSVSSDPAERAKSLLCHYFQLAWGESLSDDGISEVADIVDCIIQTVEQRTVEYRLKQLEQDMAYYKRQQKDLVALLEKASSVMIKSIYIDSCPQEVINLLDNMSNEISAYLNN
jgi:RNAse (barnase) inhibitor barstar